MKGIATKTLIEIIALAIVLVILLTVVFTPTKEALARYSSTGQCEFSVLLSGVAKQISFGTRTAPIECKTHTLDVTTETLKRYDKAAVQAIARYEREGNLQALSEYPNTDFGKNKWLVSKIVAQELLDCDNKGWKGAIPMTGYSHLWEKTGAGICILCSRIKFDPSVQHLFTPGTFPLKPWLDNNYIGSDSYMTSLTDGKTDFYKDAILPGMTFRITEPLAVVYVAYEDKTPGELSSLATGQAVVAPYNQLTTNLGWYRVKQGLDLLEPGTAFVGSETKPAYCATIIGEIE